MDKLDELLTKIKNQQIGITEARAVLGQAVITDLTHTRLDHLRESLTHYPEVVYCASKTKDQILDICRAMEGKENVLFTRIDAEKAEGIENARYYDTAGILVLNPRPVKKIPGVLVLCAGTSDLPVAEEAAVTAETLGNEVERLYDVGVAGLHRLLERLDAFERAHVIVAVAGMEGALPSVAAGLTDKPVIAVPTSVGYGASFNGLSALLAMLNSCAAGISVVNIDNGFGAGFQAAQINRLTALEEK